MSVFYPYYAGTYKHAEDNAYNNNNNIWITMYLGSERFDEAV